MAHYHRLKATLVNIRYGKYTTENITFLRSLQANFKLEKDLANFRFLLKILEMCLLFVADTLKKIK